MPLLGTPRGLDEVLDELRGLSQWRIWRDHLEKKKIKVDPNPVITAILFHEAVSFDLFDTLVDRPFLIPHEVFQFLELKVREVSVTFDDPWI